MCVCVRTHTCASVCVCVCVCVCVSQSDTQPAPRERELTHAAPRAAPLAFVAENEVAVSVSSHCVTSHQNKAPCGGASAVSRFPRIGVRPCLAGSPLRLLARCLRGRRLPQAASSLPCLVAGFGSLQSRDGGLQRPAGCPAEATPAEPRVSSEPARASVGWTSMRTPPAGQKPVPGPTHAEGRGPTKGTTARRWVLRALKLPLTKGK